MKAAILEKIKELWEKLITKLTISGQSDKQDQSKLGDKPKASGTQSVQEKYNQQLPLKAEPDHGGLESDTSTVDEASIANTESTEQKETPSPHDIGGVRNGKGGDSDKSGDAQGQNDDKPPTSHPELLCRKSGSTWGWNILLSMDKDISGRRIRHGHRVLDVKNGECKLASFCGQLRFEYEAHRAWDDIPLFSDNNPKPFIFKLKTNWAGDGRSVPRISRGYFIVIAPAEWNRTGSPPIEPERCTDEKFKAHYFLKTTNRLTEDIGGFKGHKLPIIGPVIELEGTKVFDDSDEGELFVGTVPKLTVSQDIVWARVGSEGGKWQGENFKPSEKQIQDVLSGRQGRFYVRVYGEGGKLRDSEQFRYLQDLKEIRVNGNRYSEETLLLPDITGHAATEIQFVSNGNDSQTLQGSDYSVEPDSDKDYQSRMLGNSSDTVRIVLRLPRVWWRLVTDKSGHEEWRDTPFSWTRQAFLDHAYAGSVIEVRLPLLVKSILVGFDNLDRQYQAERKEQYALASLPILDFEGYAQLYEDHDGEQFPGADIPDKKIVPLVRIQSNNSDQIHDHEIHIGNHHININKLRSQIDDINTEIHAHESNKKDLLKHWRQWIDRKTRRRAWRTWHNLNDQIDEKKKQITNKKKQIKEERKRIAKLDEQIANLRRQGQTQTLFRMRIR